jgi:hypothetical protein
MLNFGFLEAIVLLCGNWINGIVGELPTHLPLIVKQKVLLNAGVSKLIRQLKPCPADV